MTVVDELGTALDSAQAEEVLSKLRMGTPPERFVSSYSAGWDGFLEQVNRRHLQPGRAGRVRFLSGSYGSGKTHLLRLLTERAFDAGFLVTTVTLNKEEAPLSKFERVLHHLVRGITSAGMYREGDLRRAVPFGEVLHRGLLARQQAEEALSATYARARAALMADDTIDIDVRRAVCAYWATFSPAVDQEDAELQDQRALVLQWFVGEGKISAFKALGLQKLIDRNNAARLLDSLSKLARHLGHTGLLVLLDEAEMSYALMRRTDLRQAHNNLLHLLNDIEVNIGLVVIYAATPDFYADPHHGMLLLAPLAQRIGELPQSPPRAISTVWNIDLADHCSKDHREAAWRMRQLYCTAEPEDADLLPERAELDSFVDALLDAHPAFAQISTWRMLVTCLVREFDRRVSGDSPKQAAEAYVDTMAQFRD